MVENGPTPEMEFASLAHETKPYQNPSFIFFSHNLLHPAQLNSSLVCRAEREAKMPLGERAGWDKSESRYCGVETDFTYDLPQLLSYNLSPATAGFDFLLAPLVRFLSLSTISVIFY